MKYYLAKISILVSFWATIDQKINFTQNTYTPPSFPKKKLLSIADAFRKIHFSPPFYQFSQWMRCAIFQINTNLLITQRNINIFRQETLFPPSFQIKIYAVHRRIFQKYRLFTAILVFLTVEEVCYISNKYQPPYDLVQPQYFYTRDFILSLLHFEKKLALSIANVFLNIHFLPLFSLFLKVSSICNTSSKC